MNENAQEGEKKITLKYINHGRNLDTYWNLRGVAGYDCMAYKSYTSERN